MKRFIVKTILLAAVIAVMLPTVMQADINTEPQVPDKIRYQLLANSISAQYAVPAALTKKIINCEDLTWNPDAHNYNPPIDDSWGLVQINRLSHSDISIKQATDPTFAITYLAQNIAAGHSKKMWVTCSK